MSQPPQPSQSPAPDPKAIQTLPPPTPGGESIPPEVNRLISEEVLRARVLEIIQSPHTHSRGKRFLNHQLTGTLLTFVLTGIVGLLITSWWEQSRLKATRRIEQERRETDARIAAFTDFLGTVSEQHAQSALVDDAFKNGAPMNELAVLVRNEQEIFARSQNKTGVLTFTIRELVPSQTYEKIKNALDSGLIEPLREARVNHGHMYYQMSVQPNTQWKSISGISPRLSTCTAALTQAIWYNAIASSDDEVALTKKKDDSLTEMQEDCKK